MKEFVGHRAKTYAYLMDNDSKKKKVRGTKKEYSSLMITKIDY